MSISLEYALEHKNDPAVLCCRAEEGTVLNEHNLEDPILFPDLCDTGLLDVTGAYTIGQVLGATLTKTCDSLTPLKPENTTNIQEVADDAAEEEADEAEAPAVAVPAVPAGTEVRISGGVVKLYIAEGKDIAIEFPV